MPWNDGPKGPGNGTSDNNHNSGEKPNPGPDPWGARPRPGGSDKPHNQGPHNQGPHNPNAQSPWGERPETTRPRGGDSGPGASRLDDLLKRANERFGGGGNNGGGFGGGRGRGSRMDGGKFLGGFGLPAFGALALLGWLSTGVFVVDAGEVAVIQTLGRYDGLRQPGLHVRLPNPLQSHRAVNTQRPERLEVGARKTSDDAGLMLTGDEAIVNIGFSVFWRVNDPEKFLFNIEDPESAVLSAAESAMREVVGKRKLEPIITGERDLVANSARELTQKILDFYGAGVEVTQVNLTSAEPPSEVVTSFRDVANAGQEAEASINGAETTRNKIVPAARGEAAKIVQDAEAYRERVVRDAEGEAARFNSILDQYRRAPEVTRRRMYLETLERIYGNVDKIILDERAGGAVPYLPLGELRNQTSQGAGR